MIKRTERGWAGHLICSSDCQFRRNTLIEKDDLKIIISTVGGLLSKDRKEVLDVGCNRQYETMVFLAKKDGAYWEADVYKNVSIDSKWYIEKVTDSSDNDADEMHEIVVKEIINKLENNIKLEIW